jgi:hypothetical protein
VVLTWSDPSYKRSLGGPTEASLEGLSLFGLIAEAINRSGETKFRDAHFSLQAANAHVSRSRALPNCYVFLSPTTHLLLSQSHMPPAFSQAVLKLHSRL